MGSRGALLPVVDRLPRDGNEQTETVCREIQARRCDANAFSLNRNSCVIVPVPGAAFGLVLALPSWRTWSSKSLARRFSEAISVR